MTSNQRSFRLAQRSLSICLVATGILAQPNVSHAQGVDEFGPYGYTNSVSDRQSAENFALELRFGPYLPHVDSEFSNGTTPFKDYFGTSNRVALGVEFDWLPLVVKDVFRFGPGVGFMYTNFGGKGIIAKDGARSDQATSLRVLPHWATAVLRIDALEKRTWIPLAFSAKLGLADALWWISDEPRTRKARYTDPSTGVDYMTNISGRGRSYGVYWGLGVHLDLGFLDTMRKKRLDSFTGINRIYLFGEIYGLELNSFGKSGNMTLTDRSWVLGMSFDL
jgi:hypothetical protein